MIGAASVYGSLFHAKAIIVYFTAWREVKSIFPILQKKCDEIVKFFVPDSSFPLIFSGFRKFFAILGVRLTLKAAP